MHRRHLKSNQENMAINSSNARTFINGKNTKLSKEESTTSITLTQGASLIIGIMIGSGIFVSPKFVLEKSGSVGMMVIIWIFSGVIAMLGALCYCELGTLIPKSGGEYIYFKEAYGSLPAFLVSWTIILVLKPASIAIICMAFANYICLPFLPDESTEPTVLIKVIAMLCIVLLTIINCVSTKLAAQTQVLFTGMKLLAIGLVVMIGLYNLAIGKTKNFENLFNGTNSNPGKLAHAFYSGLWAFDGWNQLNYVTGELKNPAENLPKAVMIALPLVTMCYALVNVAYLCVLTPAEVVSSSAVAVSFGEKIHPVFLVAMPLLVACSCFGAGNGSVFTNGRVVCAAAKEGHMPPFLATINTRLQMPIYAVAFPSVIAILFLLPSNLESLISCFSFVAWMFYGGTILSLLVLRVRMPTKHRPYRVWTIVPIVMVIVALYLVIAPFIEKPKDSALALMFILAGIPFYFIFSKS